MEHKLYHLVNNASLLRSIFNVRDKFIFKHVRAIVCMTRSCDKNIRIVWWYILHLFNVDRPTWNPVAAHHGLEVITRTQIDVESKHIGGTSFAFDSSANRSMQSVQKPLIADEINERRRIVHRNYIRLKVQIIEALGKRCSCQWFIGSTQISRQQICHVTYYVFNWTAPI